MQLIYSLSPPPQKKNQKQWRPKESDVNAVLRLPLTPFNWFKYIAYSLLNTTSTTFQSFAKQSKNNSLVFYRSESSFIMIMPHHTFPLKLRRSIQQEVLRPPAYNVNLFL
ncbi:hypothetical protein NPIL_46021 [Nephila pilipes]|uniref:Uncharacterized protein n=1 Tax=Nephila pilipes TaxID=299642 RepID=A0A8X6QDI4_NEPPI|nr:hypothetical protein NPIL_46021 [Nephila pilipes]